MIPRKLSALDIAQGFGTALVFTALVMLLPLAYAMLIIGLAIVGVATYAEHRQRATPLDEPEPVDPVPTPVGD